MITNIGLEALFDNASIGIAVISPDGKIASANKHLLSQFGYTKDELIGKDIESLLPGRFRNSHISHRIKFFRQPQNRPMGKGPDLYAITKQGTEFPVEVSLTHYSVENAHFAAAYIVDITHRKAIEKDLIDVNNDLAVKIDEHTRALRETVEELKVQISQVEAKDYEVQKANSYLKSIWNYAGAIIIATDKNGKIELFNHTAEELLGYHAKEVVGKHTPLIFHDEEEVKLHAIRVSEELQTPIATGFETFVTKACLNISDQGEWTYIHKEGKRFPVDLTITALKNGTGEIQGFLGIAFDISVRKKAEAELKSALQKEKEVNELKSRFVSIASHEFRTPLSTIVSSAYLISQYKSSDDQDKRNKHIERIVSSANMLTDILNDFLSVGKIEGGKILIHQKEFDIAQYVIQITNELQSLLKKGQVIHYEHEGQEMVISDPSMIKHIIFNLLSNAIKFSPDNASIVLKTVNKDHQFSLSVKDKGIGIPVEDQPHLFELFYRASNANNIQGTGLGLHIIKKYTEMLNGEIKCTSRINEGTEFEIFFK